MHIGMIHLSAGSFPPDIRVEKETNALVGAGFDVSVLCPRIDDEATEEKLESGATVYRRCVKRRRLLRRILGAYDCWTLQHLRWQSHIEKFLNQTQADILHVHDLNMVPATLSVARKHGVPVVADFHENMPAAIRAWRADRPWLSRLRSSITSNGVLYRLHETRSARRCEKIIVVVPEAAERFLKKGIPEDKLVVVSNTEDETTIPFPPPALEESVAAKYENRWMASYVGGIGPHRGIDTVVKGVRAIVKEVPNFFLLIVGANDRARQVIEKLASQCGVSEFVQVLGWTPFEECLQYVLASKACLVPHNDFEHTQTTVPHKLFQYMIYERPVVVSDCQPLKRIVETTGAGVVFKANDPNDFAKAIIRLAHDEELCTRCAAGGKKAALGDFAWKHDAARLVTMYEEIGRKYSWQT